MQCKHQLGVGDEAALAVGRAPFERWESSGRLTARLGGGRVSRRNARKPLRASAARDEHEAMALRIHQIAAVAGVIAESQEEPDQGTDEP